MNGPEVRGLPAGTAQNGSTISPDKSTLNSSAGSPFNPEQEKILADWTRYYPFAIMGLISAMREVQKWHLCVNGEDEEYLSVLFKTTRGRVHELATFFPFFTQKPTGRHRIGLCRGLSCAMAGSRDMGVILENKLGVSERETTPDGKFSFETMECLGACDFAPAVIVNERLKGKATKESIDDWVGSAQ
jgi:NADH:ubiquinone oxidoreductase subunit E